MGEAIVCDQLTKHFGAVHAVEELSFAVDAGEVVGFLGPNGAGKTTTIRLLLDLIRPTRRAGRGARREPAPRRRGAPAPDRLRPGRSRDVRPADRPPAAGAVCRVARAARPDRGRAARRTSRCRRSIARSGRCRAGNRQKLGVVQAFFHEPELLILDEPTSGLDPVAQREFRSLVREATVAWLGRAAVVARAVGGAASRRSGRDRAPGPAA